MSRLRVPGFFAVSAGDPPLEALSNGLKGEGEFVAGIAKWVFENIFSTKNRSVADLWIIQYDSKFDNGTGKYGTNLDFGPWNYPHPWDTIIVPLELETGAYWHPGGLSTMGDILAVPLQSYLVDSVPTPANKTVFLYLHDPKNPVRIDMEVPLGGGNSSMVKLPSGRYLIQISGTWLLSKTTNFADGFDTDVTFGGAPRWLTSQHCQTMRRLLLHYRFSWPRWNSQPERWLGQYRQAHQA